MLGGNALAQPVHLVVPFPPGGNVDIVARIVAQGLTEETKTSVIVENRAGANAIIGMEYVAKAAPDGYTIVYAPVTSVTTNAFIYKNLPYRPLRDPDGYGAPKGHLRKYLDGALAEAEGGPAVSAGPPARTTSSCRIFSTLNLPALFFIRSTTSSKSNAPRSRAN